MTTVRTLAASLVAISTWVMALQAQQGGIAQRVAAVKDGYIELRFPSRPGVCGDGRTYIRVGEHTRFGSWSTDSPDRLCAPGPVRVALRVTDGEVRRGRAYVGPIEGASSSAVIETTASEAAEYLLSLARRDAQRRIDDDLVFGAVLGENVVAWPALLDIARAQRVTGRKGHHAAVFWLGRYAAAKTAGSDNPFLDFEKDDEETDLKEHAVFVLSQLRGREGIEPMLQVARTHRDPGVRAQAMFWLGESGDPRAIDLFEEILRAR